MSYTLTLHCGCVVYVACDPKTRVPHTRVIETRGAWCRVRRHEVGLRLRLWELLPEPRPAGATLVRPLRSSPSTAYRADVETSQRRDHDSATKTVDRRGRRRWM